MQKQDKKLNQLIQKLAHPPIIIISFTGFIITMFLVNAVFKQNFNYLTQTFNYTPQYAYQLLSDIGQEGRLKHLQVFAPDILMVLLYSALLVGANYSIINKMTKSCALITAITFSPLLLSFIQIMEIIMLLIIFLQYPGELYFLAQSASVVTMVKTILTVLFFLMPLAGLLMLGVNKLSRKAGR